MIKFGVITEVDESSGMVRVNFPEDGIVSDLIPYVVPGTRGDKFFFLPAINTHVVCLMDEGLNNGACIGAIYDKNNTPGAGLTADHFSVKFKDGTEIKFNSATSELSIDLGPFEVSISATSFNISKAGDSLKTILNDVLTQVQLETHLSAAPGSPTSPPVNIAAYAAIQTRLNAFFG